MSAVLSVRIKKELKEEAEKFGINLREVVENALKQEIEKRKRLEFEKAVKVVLEEMKGISEEEFMQVIKEWRRKRA